MIAFRKMFYKLSFKTGLTRIKQRYLPRYPVTILGYHQINTPEFLREMMGWDMSPEIFQSQLEYIAKHFTVLSCSQFEQILVEKRTFPENALVITFDDGYRDVYDTALPLLKKLGLPATVFVTTDSADNRCSIWTNIVYHYFHLTPRYEYQLDFPDGSSLQGQWSSVAEKRCHVFRVNRKMKTISNQDRIQSMSLLATALDVDFAEDPYDLMPMLGWDMIRSLVQSDIFTLGSHTVSHPILSRCSVEEQRWEMLESRRRIEHETGISCRYFAYPNGQLEDFSETTCLLGREAGYALAFTFQPEFLAETQQSMAIPRHPILTSDLYEFAWRLR